MQTFDVHILGCGSALPTRRHMPSSQVVNLRDKLLMLDCGEGTQLQWRHTGLSWMKLGHIFITHSHGDHVFGLPGLISTMCLMGRTAPLFVHGPAQLRPFLQCVLANFCSDMDYEVQFQAIDTTAHAIVFEDRSMEVWSLPLDHRVACCGFLIKEKPGQPHIRREMLDFYGIPNWAINRIKDGEDWQTESGEVIPHTRLTTPADPVRSYAYVSDTKPVAEMSEWLRGINLLYHEATYGEDKISHAEKYCHSTARQAAEVALGAGVGQLLIGHYSARYDDERVLLDEARSVFENTILADEGLCLHVK